MLTHGYGTDDVRVLGAVVMPDDQTPGCVTEEVIVEGLSVFPVLCDPVMGASEMSVVSDVPGVGVVVGRTDPLPGKPVPVTLPLMELRDVVELPHGYGAVSEVAD